MENKLERRSLLYTPLAHYVGISLVMIAFGTAVAIARSDNFAFGSAAHKLTLGKEIKRLEEETLDNQEILDEIKEEVNNQD